VKRRTKEGRKKYEEWMNERRGKKGKGETGVGIKLGKRRQ
jgi:hypothetical protein